MSTHGGSRTNKDEVIAVHRQHPDWYAGDIADFLDCQPEYVRATARRYDLVLPKANRNGGILRTTERGAAITDLKFLRKAVVEGDPLPSILERIDDLVSHIERKVS